MTTIGILGSGNVGSNLAKAAIAHGYDVVLSSFPVHHLGPPRGYPV